MNQTHIWLLSLVIFALIAGWVNRKFTPSSVSARLAVSLVVLIVVLGVGTVVLGLMALRTSTG